MITGLVLTGTAGLVLTRAAGLVLTRAAGLAVLGAPVVGAPVLGGRTFPATVLRVGPGRPVVLGTTVLVAVLPVPRCGAVVAVLPGAVVAAAVVTPVLVAVLVPVVTAVLVVALPGAVLGLATTVVTPVLVR